MNVRSQLSKGYALIGALLLMLMLSGLAITIAYTVNTDAHLGQTDLSNTVAYYAAEAAMEKMATDLNSLYGSIQAPTVSNIQGLGNSGFYPTLSNASYSEYSFVVPNTAGVPSVIVRNITTGPNEGLVAFLNPMTLNVTAVAPGGEVRMVRDIEVARIPVFQFGIFSDLDLSYVPGPAFTFGGRVHTNGNLFLAAIFGVTFNARVTAALEVVRAQLANGVATTFPYNGPVNILAVGGTNRDFQEDEGSVTGGPGSAARMGWSTLSMTTYQGNIRNGLTGARRLDLAFVTPTVGPIEIIRRPAAGEDPNSLVAADRLYNKAQIRVLLSSSAEQLPGGLADVTAGKNIRLANTGVYASGVPVTGADPTYFAMAQATQLTGMPAVWDSNWQRPPGVPATDPWPLLDGYLRVEARRSNGTYDAVTQEWLQLGFARGLVSPNSEASITNTVHPNAILLFQMQADRNMNGNLSDTGACTTSSGVGINCETTGVTGADKRFNWYPINLYDTREGEFRDIAGTSNDVRRIGVMNVIELDVRNLKRWLAGTVGSTGNTVENTSQNGYIVYFSDRRGNRNMGAETGEFGFEDVINTVGSATGNPDSTRQDWEDVNDDGVLETYGGDNLLYTGEDMTTRYASYLGRKNRVLGFRHALKVVNGSLGNLPMPGFTIAAENPVYLVGNYNAISDDDAFTDSTNLHSAAAIIADAVTFLSRYWTDNKSWNQPRNLSNRTPAGHSWYRTAIAAGKNKTFARGTYSLTTDYNTFGTDGGTHNFLRYLEDWGDGSPSAGTYRLNYLGSIANFWISRQAAGVYKCCSVVYTPPTRVYNFDNLFLNPANLPPGTPMFRDIVNLGYRQVFR